MGKPLDADTDSHVQTFTNRRGGFMRSIYLFIYKASATHKSQHISLLDVIPKLYVHFRSFCQLQQMCKSRKVYTLYLVAFNRLRKDDFFSKE